MSSLPISHRVQEKADERSTLNRYLLSTLPTFLPLPSSLKLNLCSISSLRFLNTLFLLLLPLLYSALLPILNHPIHRKSTIGKSTPSKLLQLEILKDEERLEAGIIAIWPVLLFFGWIYYTDVGSTVLVLISLLASRKRFWFLSGLVSVLFSLFLFFSSKRRLLIFQ